MTINLNVAIEDRRGGPSNSELAIIKAVMDAKEILMGEISELRTEIGNMGAKLEEKVGALTTSVEELKAKVAEGVDAEELTALVAEVDAATADVKGISNRLSGMGSPTGEPTEGEDTDTPDDDGGEEGDIGGGVTGPVGEPV
jgi:outer membrane murein-binding lipoprotein Lpp